MQVAVCFPFIPSVTGYKNERSVRDADANAEDQQYFVEIFRQRDVEVFASEWMAKLLETCSEQQFFSCCSIYPLCPSNMGRSSAYSKLERVVLR